MQGKLSILVLTRKRMFYAGITNTFFHYYFHFLSLVLEMRAYIYVNIFMLCDYMYAYKLYRLR